MNQITLMGRLVRDPEMRKTQTGKDVTTFTVACDKGDKTADFIPCVAWEKNATSIYNWFKKGNRILLTGRLQSREGQTQNGEKRTYYEVVVARFEFIESRQKDEPAPAGDMTPTDDDLPF